jgi:ariadne-1
MDTDDDFMSNVSSEDDMHQDDSDNDISGDEGSFFWRP